MLNTCPICKTQFRVLQDSETEQFYRLACTCEAQLGCQAKKCPNKTAVILLESDGVTILSRRCEPHSPQEAKDVLNSQFKTEAVEHTGKVKCVKCNNVHDPAKRVLFILKDKLSDRMVHRTACPACGESGFFVAAYK